MGQVDLPDWKSHGKGGCKVMIVQRVKHFGLTHWLLSTRFGYSLFALMLLFASPAMATSVVPRSLEELVPEADYVLVATVVDVVMLDARGRRIHDSKARTGPGLSNQMRFQLQVEDVIFSRTGRVPSQVSVPLWKMWHYQLGSMQKNVTGSRGIFLLKGSGYEPVYPADFQRGLEERAEIEALLQR
jgi:hypothetical protein